jgi:hypothetical protein
LFSGFLAKEEIPYLSHKKLLIEPSELGEVIIIFSMFKTPPKRSEIFKPY